MEKTLTELVNDAQLRVRLELNDATVEILETGEPGTDKKVYLRVTGRDNTAAVLVEADCNLINHQRL